MRSGNKQFVNKRLMAGCYSSFYFCLLVGLDGWPLSWRREGLIIQVQPAPYLRSSSARDQQGWNTKEIPCASVWLTCKCPNWGCEIADFSSSALGQSIAGWDAFKISWSWLIACSLIATSIRAWLYYFLLATCSSVNPDSDCVYQLGALSLLVLHLTNPPTLANWADITLQIMQTAKI